MISSIFMVCFAVHKCYLYACWFINRHTHTSGILLQICLAAACFSFPSGSHLPRHICSCYLSLGLLISRNNTTPSTAKKETRANRQHNTNDAAADWQRDTSSCKITCDAWGVCRNMLAGTDRQRWKKYSDPLFSSNTTLWKYSTTHTSF